MYPTQMHCWGGAGNRAWVEGSDWDRDEEESGIWDNMTLQLQWTREQNCSFPWCCGSRSA